MLTLAALTFIDALPDQTDGWRPIHTQPKTGSYLVRLTSKEPRVEVCHIRDIMSGTMRTIGGLFDFDAEEPDAWMPLPDADQTRLKDAVCHAALDLRNLHDGETPPRSVMRDAFQRLDDALFALFGGER